MKKNKYASALARQRSANKRKRSPHKVIAIAAVVMGRAGGIVGGPARAEALTAKERHIISVHAANARWGNPCGCVLCTR